MSLNEKIPDFSKSSISLSNICLKQMGAGKFSRKTSNKTEEQLTSFDFSFINKAVGGNIQSLPLPNELSERTSRSLSCSHFHITSRFQGTLKISPSESTKSACLYKYWPPLFTDEQVISLQLILLLVKNKSTNTELLYDLRKVSSMPGRFLGFQQQNKTRKLLKIKLDRLCNLILQV